MTEQILNSQTALEKATEKLGNEALEIGLISDFVVRYFPDCWEFYIESNFFTPPEAYLYLKKLLGFDLNFREVLK